MSEQPLTGYDNTDANNPEVRDQEVYLYQAASRQLSCVSCNPNAPSRGVLDTPFAGEGLGLVVDRRGDWLGEYLAGSIPGWTPLGLDTATHQPRYLSNSGRLFFDSPDQLVSQAANAKEDVYEYEPNHLGSCAQSEGCVSLISSGSAQQESAFVEASEDGQDAFFVTAQPLVAGDHDTNYDLYDARICTSGSPCLTNETSSLRPCESTQTCKPESTQAPSSETPQTATPGAGTIASLPSTTASASTTKAKPRPLTRAQQLAKALKRCRKKKNRHKRAACERQARKHYAPKPKAKKSARRAKSVKGRRA